MKVKMWIQDPNAILRSLCGVNYRDWKIDISLYAFRVGINFEWSFTDRKKAGWIYKNIFPVIGFEFRSLRMYLWLWGIIDSCRKGDPIRFSSIRLRWLS